MAYKKNMTQEEKIESAKASMDARLDLLKQGFERMKSSEEYLNYLKVQSQFPNYSFRNCILIMIQKPEASRCASYQAWKKLGRNVRKGEKGIMIVCPAPYKKTIIDEESGEEKELFRMRFTSGSTFDVSQTDGEELPEICHKLTGDVDQYNKIIEKLSEVAELPISFEEIKDGSNGYYSPTENKIVIKSGMSQAQTIKTMCHEIGHSIMHSENGIAKGENRSTRELQAESVAYVVCNYLGIDSADYTFGYLAGWSEGNEKAFARSMNVIGQCANQMITALDGCF